MFLTLVVQLTASFYVGGATWRYEWNEAGMLSKVKRPDATEVSFRYDALGRRIEKQFGRVFTRWVWDGNTPLHEQRSYYTLDWDEVKKENYYRETKYPLITWVFEEGTFVPAAKLTKTEKLSIVTNYMGTPEAMYREDGEAVWTCELNSYGKVRNFQGGSKTDCPFRYQGQYEDAETGLYYNRFRYYSPEEGMYLSQDPIGLEGSNFNLYGFVFDTNSQVDIFGLDFFYQLMQDGKVVYNGITKNQVIDRIADHLNDPNKNFNEFRFVEVKDRIASRDLEGSALHNANGKGLQNALRLDSQYYHSYDPGNLKEGRVYYTPDEIDAKMKNARTGKIENGKVKICS
jgi:RHS repeat-associated protein